MENDILSPFEKTAEKYYLISKHPSVSAGRKDKDSQQKFFKEIIYIKKFMKKYFRNRKLNSEAKFDKFREKNREIFRVFLFLTSCL